MSDALALEGFTVGTPVNGTEKVDDSVVYHVDDATAQAVATSLAAKLGGVLVEPLPEEHAPIEGEFTGDVLLLLGNAQADKSIAELSGAATWRRRHPERRLNGCRGKRQRRRCGSAGRMS